MPGPDHTPSAPDTVLGVLSRGRQGNAWVVTLGGDLGPDPLAGVSRQLDDVLGEGRAVVVDTKSVTSADPAMLTLRMRLLEEVSLHVAVPSPPVGALFETAGPHAPVRTVTSLGEALDALGAGSS